MACAPHFVAEMQTYRVPLAVLQERMEEYMASGNKLGWLFVPETRIVYVYRPGQTVKVLSDSEMPGFVLDLSRIFLRRVP